MGVAGLPGGQDVTDHGVLERRQLGPARDLLDDAVVTEDVGKLGNVALLMVADAFLIGLTYEPARLGIGTDAVPDALDELARGGVASLGDVLKVAQRGVRVSLALLAVPESGPAGLPTRGRMTGVTRPLVLPKSE